MSIWIFSIRTPTTIVKIPSPSIPPVMILLVWCSSRVKPYSVLMARMRMKIEDIETPKRMALRQQAKTKNPEQIKKRLNMAENILPQSRYFILLVVVPGRQARPNLNTVIIIQKMEAKRVAFYLVLAPLSRAQEEIHPPQLSSIPTQINKDTTNKIQAFRGTTNIFSSPFYFFSEIISAGFFSFKQATASKRKSSPITGNEFIPNIQTTSGPTSPPAAKNPCSNKSQYSSSYGGLTLIAQILIYISMAEQATADRIIQIPWRKSDVAQLNKVEVKTKVKDIIARDL